MSQNDHLDSARQYHSGTKHSYLSIRMNPHILDWENKPLLFKIYPTLEVTRLPRDFHDSGVGALTAISGSPFTNVASGYLGQFDQSGTLLSVSGGGGAAQLGVLAVGSGGALTQPVSPVDLTAVGPWVITDPN